MTTLFRPLDSFNNDFHTILDHMESIWIQEGGEPGLKATYIDKLSPIFSSLNAEIIYNQGKPVGAYWIETTTPHYGNITIHVIEKKYCELITNRLVQNGAFLNTQLEIISIQFKDLFKSLFQSHKLIINERKRMALWLENHPPYHVPKSDYQYFFMTKEHAEVTGALSYHAHLISKDYEHYPEMNNCSKRIQLENRVFEGLYGPVNPTGSVLLCHNQTVIGYCLIVDINCWGYDKVPWVFDIVIHPDYMGKGLGKQLMQISINELLKQDYTVMGLGVTNSNISATKLYESLGFYVVEEFYEFIKPIQF